MRKMLIALSGAALALTVSPVSAKTYVCSSWDNGICVGAKRVHGVDPYKVGYVFGPNYHYSAVSDLPQPVVTYYKLGGDRRYVYDNGYLYEVDPSNYTVTQVIDTYPH